MKWHEAVTEQQKEAVALAALQARGGNQRDAAHDLGMPRETLNRRLKKWGGMIGLSARVTTSQRSPSSPAHQRHTVTGDAVNDTGAVMPSYSVVRSSLTRGGPVSHLAGMSAPSAVPAVPEEAEGRPVRIPSIQFTPEADEDWFISQEIAVGRLTGRARTRVAVVKDAVRFYMETKRAKEPK